MRVSSITNVPTVSFLATPFWVAMSAVERAKRAGRRPQEFYVRVLAAHQAANTAWYAEQEARRAEAAKAAVKDQRKKRHAQGGAFGVKRQENWC
jgi:hypothetical protein